MLCRVWSRATWLPFRLAKNMARAAEKDRHFLDEAPPLLPLFFCEKTQNISQKNKKKTLLVKHPYPVLGGGVSKSCFLLIFLRNVLSFFIKK